ncbi:CMT1A duplicated region transcript 1 protein-like [Asterias rubens]|uniref:CMT1A duplicated region transcript 1 protein-like n=1 Tax=Asterias rubens TaxID=7604 RepID=UPI0014557D14|nr:CMT1A duplicated region transcript 1 protein-like [Asterias rubens]XP_033630135.1 CMT1A duplicated region transcript 1 protein-like [Asterias rubens]
MKHPSKNVEEFEYNLGKAPDLRCENGTITTTCDKCESCRIRNHLTKTRQWFLRAGEKTRKNFMLGMIRRFHSINLLSYITNLLRPLIGKDFTYARSRTNPSVAGDGASTGDNRALWNSETEQRVTECWLWFKDARYWSKTNYLLGVLQMCNGELLYCIGTLARTMLAAEQRAAEGYVHEDYERASLADTVYSYRSEAYPENELLRTAGHEYSTSITCQSDSSEYLDSSHIVVEDGEDRLTIESFEMSSIDPTLCIMPTSQSALGGIWHYRDFVRELPVHLSKNILSYLEYGDLVNCMNVSRHWAHIAKEVEEDLRMRQLLWEEVMLMQGSSAQGGNPVFANYLTVPVPRLVGECRNVAPSDLPPMEVDFKSEINIGSSYRGIVTNDIQIEERNVYCGAYNVMVLSDQDDINRVVSYNYGSLVAIGSFDRHVKFLDVLTGHDTGPVITGHAGSIRCLYINDLKDYVLSGSYDTSIRCWDVKTGRCLKIFHGHQDTILCLNMSRDRSVSLVVSGGKDNVVKVWNFDNGKCLRTFKHIHQVNTVAIHGDTVVSGCEGGRVKVWSIKDACLIKTLYQSPKNTNRFGFINPHTHQGPITTVKLDDWHIVSGSRDGYALVWSAIGDHKRCVTALRHPKEVLCLEMSYLRVITGCEDGKLRIWNMLSGDCLRVMRGNSRSDPIEDIYPCGERLVLHTVNNLLVLNFEDVQWDYEQEEKIELLRYKNHYGDAPLRKHTYPFIRAKRSERAGASNPKIIRHHQAAGQGSQFGHSARTLHAKKLETAKKIQKQVRDVSFASSLKGSVYHNVQGLKDEAPGSLPRTKDGSLVDYSQSYMRSSRPPSAASRPPTASSSRPLTGLSRAVTPQSLVGRTKSQQDVRGSPTLSRPPTGSHGGSRPPTAFSTKSGILKTAKFELPLRGHSAPVRGSHQKQNANDAMTLSESKALIRSHLRTKDVPTPRDKLFLTMNCIESSKKNSQLVHNTTANALEIDYKSRPPVSPTLTQFSVESQNRRHTGRKSAAACPSEASVVTYFETQEFDKKPHISLHSKMTPSSIPKETLTTPKKSVLIRPSSGRAPSAKRPDIIRRSHSASAILTSSPHPDLTTQTAAAVRKKSSHGWTTSHTQPVVIPPMLMHGLSSIDPGSQAPTKHRRSITKILMGPPVEVKDPLKSHKEFQIRTREQTEQYMNQVSQIQKKDFLEKKTQMEALQRKLWLAKAKGQEHQDYSKKPRAFAPEIRE